jgi:hypothetical protein
MSFGRMFFFPEREGYSTQCCSLRHLSNTGIGSALLYGYLSPPDPGNRHSSGVQRLVGQLRKIVKNNVNYISQLPLTNNAD